MKKTVTLLVLISMLFSTVFLFTGCGDSSVKEIKTADDIKGASVGVQTGTTGDTFVSDYEADGTKVMRYSKGADAIVALTQNKIDCVVIDSEPAKEFVKANAGLKILDEPFAEEQYAICISKENHELTEKIDKALAELKDEGVLDKIKSYYIEGNTDTVPYESPKDIKYDGELHMATNAAFPPYEYVEGGKIVGLDPMMATAICDKLGKKLVIDFSTSYANTTQVIIVNDSASGSLFGNLGESFKNTFITDNRWQQLLSGLLVTLEITLFAGIIGVIIGFVIALVRATHDIQLDKRKCRSFGDCVLKFFNAICNIYITVIRGTPVVVQLMIMYYIILASVRNGIFAAIIAFGMNSAAYVAEIVRSGIMAVDIGQTEASRSLGFNNRQTMTMVVLPQAIKNVLPALGNEIITLLKETSVAGYVALADITYIGNMIRSRTYEAFFPLITVALIYLVIVLVLSYILRRFERRLKKSER